MVGTVPMIVLIWLAVAAAVVGIAVYAIRLKHRRDTPEELRGDWWPRFEAEFRAYVRRCEWSGGGRASPGSSRSRPAPRRDLAEGSA